MLATVSTTMPDVQIILEKMFIYGTKTFNILKVDWFIVTRHMSVDDLCLKKKLFPEQTASSKIQNAKTKLSSILIFYKTTKSSFTHEQFYS